MILLGDRGGRELKHGRSLDEVVIREGAIILLHHWLGLPVGSTIY
jgi:hypothetical protein